MNDLQQAAQKRSDAVLGSCLSEKLVLLRILDGPWKQFQQNWVLPGEGCTGTSKKETKIKETPLTSSFARPLALTRCVLVCSSRRAMVEDYSTTVDVDSGGKNHNNEEHGFDWCRPVFHEPMEQQEFVHCRWISGVAGFVVGVLSSLCLLVLIILCAKKEKWVWCRTDACFVNLFQNEMPFTVRLFDGRYTVPQVSDALPNFHIGIAFLHWKRSWKTCAKSQETKWNCFALTAKQNTRVTLEVETREMIVGSTKDCFKEAEDQKWLLFHI